MKRRLKSRWGVVIIIGIILACFIGNFHLVLLGSGEVTNAWLTFISGWISFGATLIVGLIAYRQNKKHNEYVDFRDRFVDIVVQNVEIGSYMPPVNYIGRICVGTSSNLNSGKFLILKVFCITENAVFDLNSSKITKGEEATLKYDKIQPIRSGMHDKTFLTKYELAYLHVAMPRCYDLSGVYTVTIEFGNQYGDLYEKNIDITLNANSVDDKVMRVVNHKTKLIRMEKNNG